MGPAIEMMSHIGPLGKSDGLADIEDIKSFAQLPFDMERFQKNLKNILHKIESDNENLFEGDTGNDIKEPESSDWLVHSNADQSVEEEEDHVSINDMDMV